MQDKDALDTFSAAFVFVYLEHDAHFVTTHFGETIVYVNRKPFQLSSRYSSMPFDANWLWLNQFDHDLINFSKV